jgi:hypothetical protein
MQATPTFLHKTSLPSRAYVTKICPITRVYTNLRLKMPQSIPSMAQLLTLLQPVADKFNPVEERMNPLAGTEGARPYQGASNPLMGYRRNGPQKPYEDSNYKTEIKVRVHTPESELFGQKIGGSFEDGMRGLNRAHALERAYRNWPNATNIEIIE